MTAKPKEHKGEKTCFIAMPISTPEHLQAAYNGDANHFKHVLHCLFIPAIEKAGFEAIPPISKGSDMIHADIVHQLETADLVLVDMTSLNANVFFEFGIRVALDLPICLVRDKRTSHIPFDINLINNHTYSGELNAWELGDEIASLAQHVKEAVAAKASRMTLWNAFSFSQRAERTLGETPTQNESLAFLALQIESMAKKIEMLSGWSDPVLIPNARSTFAFAIETNFFLTRQSDINRLTLASSQIAMDISELSVTSTLVGEKGVRFRASGPPDRVHFFTHKLTNAFNSLAEGN